MRQLVKVGFLLSIAGLLAVIVVPATAQFTVPGGPAVGVPHQNRIGQPLLRRMHRLAPVLGISASQRQQMAAIVKDTRSQARLVRRDAALAPEQKRVQIKALRKAMRQQVRALLTPEQRAKLREMRHARRTTVAPPLQ